jgi:hypothetical protein
MSTSTAPHPSARAAFDALVDYAGLFPPAKLPLSEALDEYRRARAGTHAWMLGRFIVPASLLLAGESAIDAGLSVIVDADRNPRQWFASAQKLLGDLAALRDAHVAIEALEVPLPALSSQRETYDATIGQLSALIDRAGLRDLPAYAEIPRAHPSDPQRDVEVTALLNGAMTALSRAKLGAKIRCGGLSADAFPSVDEVAAFLAAATEANVAFKATAGLHHPVRHRDASTGFMMHGFLNLLVAAALAPDVDGETLRRVIAEEDAAAFVFDEASLTWRDHRVTVDRLATTRTHSFIAYGSCSFSEPVDDLTDLGVLPRQ